MFKKLVEISLIVIVTIFFSCFAPNIANAEIDPLNENDDLSDCDDAMCQTDCQASGFVYGQCTDPSDGPPHHCICSTLDGEPANLWGPVIPDSDIANAEIDPLNENDDLSDCDDATCQTDCQASGFVYGQCTDPSDGPPHHCICSTLDGEPANLWGPVIPDPDIGE